MRAAVVQEVNRLESDGARFLLSYSWLTRQQPGRSCILKDPFGMKDGLSRVRVWERGRQLERGSGDGYKI